MKLSDRVVLITGCSSGIGYSTANLLKNRGYRVFATARKSEDVARLQAEGFESLQLDLRHSDSIKNAVQTMLEKTDGRIYALFNNAGYSQPGAVEDLSREALREQFETNLFGTHELTCQILPAMRDQGEGRIIQNSSMLGFIALTYRGAYIASKHALEGLTDTLRLEFSGTNIYFSLIEPGPILTKIRANSRYTLEKYVDTENSFHSETYATLQERILKEGEVVPFTAPPEAVTRKVIHALESSRPKVRYYVTFPAHLFARLKCVLPARTLDWLLRKV
jgi:NAD(P)-dependent dehydrogenase (short-subunit alcohol dehydrogenase family)